MHGGAVGGVAVLDRIHLAAGDDEVAAGFQHPAFGDQEIAVGGRQQVELEFDGQHFGAGRHQGQPGITAGAVHNRGGDAGVEEAVLLGEVGAEGQADFAMPGGQGAHFGAEMGALAPGHCEIRLPFRADLTQQNGFFHAGITATIVDSAGGYAGLTLMSPGAEVLTVEFKLNLLAPADGDFLVAEGRVLKSGRNLVIARGEVYAIKNGHATHCATMQQTLMTMHAKKEK